MNRWITRTGVHVVEEETLDTLRHDWGTAYSIRKQGDLYTAQRVDGFGTLYADSPGELLDVIRVDYARCAVPRGLEPVRRNTPHTPLSGAACVRGARRKDTTRSGCTLSVCSVSP